MFIHQSKKVHMLDVWNALSLIMNGLNGKTLQSTLAHVVQVIKVPLPWAIGLLCRPSHPQGGGSFIENLNDMRGWLWMKTPYIVEIYR